VIAVSSVLLGSSQSSSKKSSGGTNGPYHPVRMRICRNPRHSGQSLGVAQTAPDTIPDALQGRVVAGRYRLTDILGRGGFGAVYTGHDSDSGEAVAVKVFSRGEGLAPRADREARTARKLDHPNIHEVVGVAHDDDHAYLISELIVGERLDRSGLSDEQAVRAIAAVCDALAHAHERGVVHRDVKPANILVSTDGTVHLTDFGIARDEDAREPTVDERLLGTLSYMAPEQASGQRATGATDVWSAGLTLYAALAGRNPYRARSLAELLENLGHRAPPLHRVRPDLPRELSRALEHAMHPDPGRRPSAAGFRDLLLAAIAEPAVAAAPGWAPEAAAARPGRTLVPGSVRSLAVPAASTFIVAFTALWLLTAFPMYPPSWTVPIAALLGVAAWRHPRAAAVTGGVLAVPAFWNYAEAAGLAWIALAVTWMWASGRTAGGRDRLLVPLLAVPLALAGFGMAFVIVAATAPSRARRAVEGAAGALVAAVCGGWAGARLTHSLAGASSPLRYAQVIDRDPALAATAAALPAFAVLLAMAWRAQRRTQALALWGLGFALAAIAIPDLVANRPLGLGAEVATGLTAIIPAAWAVAGPKRASGG
jgi:eukaryotic-like serine/threonine-protein kinase